MLATKPKKTVDDYMKLPEQPRVELFEGEFFMTPSPNDRHQITILNLAKRLDDFVRGRRLGRVFIAPFDCILSDEDVVQPDVIFVAAENLHRIRERLHGPPDLAVEVLSAAHAERDRIVKRDLYAKYGVREYWIADPDARTTEVYELAGSSYALRGIFGPGDDLRSPLLPDLRISVAEMFE